MLLSRGSLAPLCAQHGASAKRRLILREVAVIGVSAPLTVAPSFLVALSLPLLSPDTLLAVILLKPVEQLAQHARPDSTFLSQAPGTAADGFVFIAARGGIAELIQGDGDVPGALAVRREEDGHEHPERGQDAAANPDGQEQQQQGAAFHHHHTTACASTTVVAALICAVSACRLPTTAPDAAV